MVHKIKIFVVHFTIDPQLLLSSNFSMSIVPYYQLFVIMGNLKILLKASIWTTLVVGVLENTHIQFWMLWNPESEIGNPGLWIHAPQRIRILQTTGIPNPSSTDKKSRIQYLESGIHRVESGILGFGIHAAQRIWILQTTGISNPSSTDKESRIQYLESVIHGVESRIQDCLGFRYTGG